MKAFVVWFLASSLVANAANAATITKVPLQTADYDVIAINGAI